MPIQPFDEQKAKPATMWSVFLLFPNTTFNGRQISDRVVWLCEAPGLIPFLFGNKVPPNWRQPAEGVRNGSVRHRFRFLILNEQVNGRKRP